MNFKLITIILLAFLLVPAVNSIETPQALQIKEIMLPNGSTSAGIFETIATTSINLTAFSDIDVVVSFQARRVGGTGTDNYTWRFLIDEIPQLKNITRSLAGNDVGSVVFSNDRDDLPVGVHNITFQHLSTDGTLFSENINIVINLHLLENNSRINHKSGDIDTIFASTDYIEVESGFMQQTETGTTMVIFSSQISSSAVNTVEFLIEFNNENSSTFRRRIESSDDVGTVGYVWQYNNVTAGNISWKLWGRNTEAVTTEVIGHLDLDQMINDNVSTIMSHFINETTRITDDGVFVKIANVTIPTVRNNSLYAVGTFTINIENQGGVSRNVSYFLQIDGINSPQNTRILNDVNDVGNIFVQDIFNDSTVTHNVSLFATAQLGAGRILVVSNVSMFAMEVIDFESVMTIPPSEPVITLISPVNNTINGTFPLNISFDVTDNADGNIVCQLNNRTVIFDNDSFAQGTNFLTLQFNNLTSLSQTFPNLNLSCADSFGNTASMLLNYTIDRVLPAITLISPANLSRFNKDIIITINIHSTCFDTNIFNFNITVSNSSGTITTYQDNTAVDGVLEINENLDITGLGIDNYTITNTCADQHNQLTRKSRIDDYRITKSKATHLIKWETPEGNEIEISCSADEEILSYGSSKSEDGQRYNFFYKVNGSKGVTRTLYCEIENKIFPVKYMADSDYKAHFITGNNYIDFELDDPDAEYFVFLNYNKNYEVEITTTLSDIKFNSVGELNIAEVETEFELFFIEQFTDFFTVIECKTDVGSVILLSFFIFIGLVLIIIGLATRIGFIGFFGAIILMATSWYIAPCIRIIAFLMTLISILLMFFFIFRGVWSNSLIDLD